MKTQRIKIQAVPFKEFVEKYNLTVIIKELPEEAVTGMMRHRFIAKLLGAIREETTSVIIQGSGQTEENAINDLIEELQYYAGETLVVYIGLEIELPYLTK